MANQMGDASGGRPSGKGKPLNSIEHKTSKPTKAWIKKELAQQQKRFKQILQNMNKTINCERHMFTKINIFGHMFATFVWASN